MFLINCPWCGEREQREFRSGGEAHIARPLEPEHLNDGAWAEYLFMRSNTKGRFLERWVHSEGCRRWFNVARNTANNEVEAVYLMGETPPKEVSK